MAGGLWAVALLLLQFVLQCRGLYDPVHHIESARIYGNIDSYAYYFLDLLIGTPPQRVSVIVDTGSGVTAFPCRSCPHCGHHIDPNFDFSKSSSASWTSCGTGCHGSCGGGHCSYRQGYTEGSSISGWYFTDDVRMGDALQRNPPVRVSMGCHQDENKLFYTQKANGIMGIRPPGRGTPTIFDSLFADKAHIDSQVFSMCLAEWGGRLVVGGYNQSYHTGSIVYVPLQVSSGYYNVGLTKMVIDGKTLATRYGTAMIDSGTTYTYMASEPYKALRNGIESYCRSHNGCGAHQSGTCWEASSGIGNFPKVEVWFNEVKTFWVPQAYLYRKGSSNRYCYGFEDDGPRANTVLGASWMMWQEIIFDMRVNKAGIVAANCPNYKQRPDFSGREDVTVPTAASVVHPVKTALPAPAPAVAEPAAAAPARPHASDGAAAATAAVNSQKAAAGVAAEEPVSLPEPLPGAYASPSSGLRSASGPQSGFGGTGIVVAAVLGATILTLALFRAIIVTRHDDGAKEAQRTPAAEVVGAGGDAKEETLSGEDDPLVLVQGPASHDAPAE